ncbi:hypothetical protein K490DRAFT_12632, partial [Saccharata proteae CBS 121410]
DAADSDTPAVPRSDSDPPKLFILPKDVSSEARVISLPNPANGATARYYCCPRQGFYEFTRIAAPKSAPRSWLLTPERRAKASSASATTTIDQNEEEPEDQGTVKPEEDAPTNPLAKGYITKSPDIFLATPFDALFITLPALVSAKETQKQMFLSIDDYLDKLSASSPHLRELLYTESIKRRLEERVAAVCDTVEAGEEKMYRISMEKLAKEVVSKAQRLTANGLPASLEEKFVRTALEKPVMNIRREDSSVSAVSETATDGTTPVETPDTQISTEAASGSQASKDDTTSTAATSFCSPPAPSEAKPAKPEIDAPEGVPELLRLRTAIDFICSSYLSAPLRQQVQKVLSSLPDVDFSPLRTHMEHLASLRSQAQALRSISDNVSRKRATMDDDEAAEARAEKKRKKDEEDAKKKNQSRGVKQLAKADTSGMKKLSAFFTK